MEAGTQNPHTAANDCALRADCPMDILGDLLHRCPVVLDHLWHSLNKYSLSALLPISRGIRRQISAVLRHHYMVILLPVQALHVVANLCQMVASKAVGLLQGFKRFPSTGLTTYQSWSALQNFHISSSKITPAAATYLVGCSLPQLRRLHMSSCPLTS